MKILIKLILPFGARGAVFAYTGSPWFGLGALVIVAVVILGNVFVMRRGL